MQFCCRTTEATKPPQRVLFGLVGLTTTAPATTATAATTAEATTGPEATAASLAGNRTTGQSYTASSSALRGRRARTCAARRTRGSRCAFPARRVLPSLHGACPRFFALEGGQQGRPGLPGPQGGGFPAPQTGWQEPARTCPKVLWLSTLALDAFLT